MRGGRFITYPNCGSRFKILIPGPRPVLAQHGPVQVPSIQTETVSIRKNKKESAHTILASTISTNWYDWDIPVSTAPKSITSSVNKTIPIQMRSVWSPNLVDGLINMAYGLINTVKWNVLLVKQHHIVSDRQ